MSRSTAVEVTLAAADSASLSLVAVSGLISTTTVSVASGTFSSITPIVSTLLPSSDTRTTLQTASATMVVQSTAGNSAPPVAAIVGGALGGLAIICLFLFGVLFIRRREHSGYKDPGHTGPVQKLGPPPHPSITPFPPHPEVSQSAIPTPTSTSNNHISNGPPAACKYEKARQTSPVNVDVSEATTSPSVYTSSTSPSQPPHDPPPGYGE